MTSEVSLLNGKTVGDLYDYLIAATKNGEISVSLSDHLRTAVKKIFVATCSPDEFWRNVLLSSVDIDSRIATFRANSSSTCSDQTIHVYYTRYIRSTRLFIEHLQQQPPTSPPLNPAPNPPSGFAPASSAFPTDTYFLAMQKILQASITFQQEILSATALLNPQKGDTPPMSPPSTK